MADFVPNMKKELDSLNEFFQPIFKYAKNFLFNLKFDKIDLKKICCTIILRVNSVFNLVNLFTGFPPIVEILVNAFVVGFVASVTLNIQELIEMLSLRKSPSKAVVEIEADEMVKDSLSYLQNRLRKITPVMEELEKMEILLKELQKKDNKQEIEDMLNKYHNCILSVRLDVKACIMKLEYLKPWIDRAIKELDEGSSRKEDSDTEAVESLKNYRRTCKVFEEKLNKTVSKILKKEVTVQGLIDIVKSTVESE